MPGLEVLKAKIGLKCCQECINVLQKKITISVPSSVANVSCGFDVLGFCLDKPCDEMTVEIKKTKGLEIKIINEKSITTDPKNNVCGPVAFAMIKKLNLMMLK